MCPVQWGKGIYTLHKYKCGVFGVRKGTPRPLLQSTAFHPLFIIGYKIWLSSGFGRTMVQSRAVKTGHKDICYIKGRAGF